MSDQESAAPTPRPAGHPTDEQPVHERTEKTTDYQDPVDDAADDSFPASDPPSFTDTTATRNPGR